jgi:thymidylate synthase
MKFEALYYDDKLTLVNPAGDVGVVTLWSRKEQIISAFERLSVDFDPQSSRIAVIGNLFGNGLPHLLRNLLWNPQIQYLLVLGSDLSGSKLELANFFAQGLEEVDFLGSPAHRIIGTQRIIDGDVTAGHFVAPPEITLLGKVSDEQTLPAVTQFFAELPPPREAVGLERVDIPIPESKIEQYPSEPRSHTIVRNTPIEAWQELVFRLVRFGRRVTLKKGVRTELQSVKVIVEYPQEEPEADLAAYGFSLQNLRHYQQRLLDPIKPDDQPYSYGNRIRGYFHDGRRIVDGLQVVIEQLLQDPESRKGYISLWDTHQDLTNNHSAPCLVSLYFRKYHEKLTLQAQFRTHNGMTAWLENFYGLMGLLQFVASGANLEPGSIVVVSDSISIAEDVMDTAKKVAESKQTDEQVSPETGKREPRYDYNGNFTVTTDLATHEIVVQHSYEGMALCEYRDRSAEALEKQIARDYAVSEISHALYLGREIARAEYKLKSAQRQRKN